MNKKKIAIIFGGCSSEHEISCMSAASVINNLPKDKYEVVCIGITKEGRWYLFSGPIEKIADGSWARGSLNRPAFISPDRNLQGIVIDGKIGFDVINVDCVFPVLHGKNGEDGTIQGLLQLSAIPFVGCRARASADCMDKAITHTLLTAAGINQAKYLWFYADKYTNGSKKIKLKINARFGYPIFVKPANSGSSVGISKVNSEAELDKAIAKAAHEDDKIIVEEAIVGQEVECAILGNKHPKASLIGEIAPSAEFYDYDDKYHSDKSQLHIPAHLDESVTEEIRATAVRAYHMLGCSGLSRVDFFVKNGKEVILNEINTMPGFTSISMYPKLWEACGISYSELLDKLIMLALDVDSRY